MNRMLMGRNERVWVRPVALAAISEAAYLLYFHVPVSMAHTVPLFNRLPFGAWRAGGAAQVSLLYLVCMATLFATWALLLRDLSHRPERRSDRMLVFGGAAAFCITLLFVPSLLSKDLFDYMGHGRVMSEHAANPYLRPASSFLYDEFTRAMGWPQATPLYGPAWATLCGLLARLGGGHFLLTALFFKIVFAASHLICGTLVWRIARDWSSLPGRGTRSLRAAAFYLWNPLVLTQTAADAHNDVLVLLFLLIAIRMFQRRDDLTASATLALSVLVKYVTGPIALLLTIQRGREAGWRRAALVTGVGAGVAVLAWAPYAGGFEIAHFLRPYEHSAYQGGLMMMLEMSLVSLIGGGKNPGSPVARLMMGASLLAAASLGIWYVRACLTRTRSLPETVEASTRLLLYYLLFVTALLRTSYVVWIVGLAAIAASVPLRRMVAIFSASILSLEIYWLYRALQPAGVASLHVEQFLASGIAVGAPILYLLPQLRGWRARSRAREEGS